jgi:predicted Fe-Mo cluster-binding NifX family protein
MIAVTVLENSTNPEVDPRFGRAAGFILVNSDTGKNEWIENSQNIHSAHGAGIQAAANLVEKGVKIVLTGAVGPKAFRVLNEAGVKVFCGCKGKSLEEALEAYNKGSLEETSGATSVGLG